MSPADEIKRRLQECTPDERRAIFEHLRQEFTIHPLEDQLNAKAEVILGALERATEESDGWTRDFERCVSWFRSGHRRTICEGG